MGAWGLRDFLRMRSWPAATAVVVSRPKRSESHRNGRVNVNERPVVAFSDGNGVRRRERVTLLKSTAYAGETLQVRWDPDDPAHVTAFHAGWGWAMLGVLLVGFVALGFAWTAVA